MIDIKDTTIAGLRLAIIGTRNYKSSWEDSDTYADYESGVIYAPGTGYECRILDPIVLGAKDEKLLRNLVKAGAKGRSHCKFLRQIQVWFNLKAPLIFWRQFDTYKIGVNCQSTSTMNNIMDREFSLKDFDILKDGETWENIEIEEHTSFDIFASLVNVLNMYREYYLTSKDTALRKKWESRLYDILPQSYMQLRTINLNYEVLASIYRDRKNHKLGNWKEFCEWIEKLPYSWMITGKLD